MGSWSTTASGSSTSTPRRCEINLDKRRYGTFAEIGAGQEVVRWFFRVGGAAGTVAKSMSAYDMTVSDAIYGKAERYVCRPRLEAMLEHEHRLNLERLAESRGETTAFFAFADTVSARNYRGTNECHGWMGVRFQSRPHDRDSQIVIHVRMLDGENALQQEALGIVGVNLLYGAFFFDEDPELLIESLLDGLTTHRIAIDMIEFSGIEFREVDNRLMSMKLVQLGLSGAAMFDPERRGAATVGGALQEERAGRAGQLPPRLPREHGHAAQRPRELRARSRGCRHPVGDVVELMELTMRNLREEGGEVDRADFLARADMLAASGKTVLISDYFEYYRLAAYLAQYTNQRIAITMGASSLRDLFDEKYYAALEGGILESFGRLFKNDLRLYIYPLLDQATGKLVTVDNLEVAPHLQKLYGYLVDNGSIKQLENVNRDYLHIFSRDALRKIRAGDASWESMVPPQVAEVIKTRRFLGYLPPKSPLLE